MSAGIPVRYLPMDSKQKKTNGLPDGPIGVFDSGYGGLTVLRDLQKALPDADFMYLGDNARAPYGTRSFELVYQFTLQAVRYLFGRGCPLVILACNTASAKALRSIQQNDLPVIAPQRRVLGVIRPTVEILPSITRSGTVGLFGTPGTVASGSYDMEIAKLNPRMKFFSHACPMWVPLVENMEVDSDGADYFVRRDIETLTAMSPEMDTVILGCTHYPLLLKKIRRYMPERIAILTQGEIVARSLTDYLRRHTDIAGAVTRGGNTEYLTTENASRFSAMAGVFMGTTVKAAKIELN